jgi:hypothetical protein
VEPIKTTARKFGPYIIHILLLRSLCREAEKTTTTFKNIIANTPAVIEGERSRQMFENVVVWGERGGGEHRAEDGVGGVVEGITRDQGPCSW